MIDKNWLIRRARQAAPYEACGFVLSDFSIVEIPNVASNPMLRFEMSRRHLSFELYDKVIAIWHTHPKGSPHPSGHDLSAITQGVIQKHWDYLIVTADDVFSFDTKSLAPQDDSFWGQFVSLTPAREFDE